MSVINESPTYLQQRLFYQGRKFSFDVHSLRLYDGVEGDWEYIRHPGGTGCPHHIRGETSLG